MTLGPDLDWLGDDEGNLRPEAARAIAQQGAPPPPALQRAAVNRPPRLGQARLQLATPRIAVTPAWLPVVVIGAAVAGLLAGRLSGSGSRPADLPGRLPVQQPVVASPSGDREAVVNGINVNLRAGPGLFAPVLRKLVPGESVRVSEKHGGWFVAETSSGLRGFVFGALLRGVSSVEGAPATLTQPMRAVIRGEAIELRPGDRVLVRLDPGGSATILLSTGVRLGVSQNAVAFLD